MENTKRFELSVIADKQTRTLQVKDFEQNKALALEIINDFKCEVIDNNNIKKIAKEKRATYNKVIKAIDRIRIDNIADFVSEFEEQCKSIKEIFENEQSRLGKLIKDYEDSQKIVISANEKVIKYVAEIKFVDESVIEKLTNFCKENNLDLRIKEN